jgi:hypothetical protein
MAKDKATKQAERAERQQLKSAQSAEIKALKSSGATAAERSAEKDANSAELRALLKAQKSGTYTPNQDLTGIRSAADTYANSAYADNVYSLLNSAAQNYTDYNISTINKSGNVTTGVGLDKLVDYELGQSGSKFNELMNRAQTFVGNSFSAADLEAQGVTLKADKNNPGFYKWSTGGDGNKEITYFTQNPDGTFTGAGINRVRTEAQDKGFFDSPLGQIALGLGSFYFGVPFGVIGGGLLGGGASVLGGGKFGQGAITGALGGFGGAGGFSNIPGISDITSNLPSFSDIPGVRDISNLFTGGVQPTAPVGETLSGALTGTGQNLGSFGQLGSAMPFNPADIALNPVIPGVESQIGTAGFGTALRPAGSLAADLVAAGFSPGTAANLAGTTAAGVGATNLLGGATAFAPVAPSLSLFDTLRGMTPKVGNIFSPGGISPFDVARLVQPPPPEEAGGGGFAGANADYRALISALSAPRVQPRSLV